MPPFDLPKFMQETCKKHWLDLDEKSTKWTDETQGDAKLRLEYLKKHFKSSTTESTSTIPTLNAQIQSHFRKTQQSIVGQLTANLMSHDLMLHNTTPGQTWGDYAVYDCVGCHQTLYKNIRGGSGTTWPSSRKTLGISLDKARGRLTQEQRSGNSGISPNPS